MQCRRERICQSYWAYVPSDPNDRDPTFERFPLNPALLLFNGRSLTTETFPEEFVPGRRSACNGHGHTESLRDRACAWQFRLCTEILSIVADSVGQVFCLKSCPDEIATRSRGRVLRQREPLARGRAFDPHREPHQELGQDRLERHGATARSPCPGASRP